MSNFSNIPTVDFSWFNYEESSCYTNENKLYNNLATEAINSFGVKTYYYKTDYNTKKDRVFGEDTDRDIIRKFVVNAYFTLPDDDKIYNQFGIGFTETLMMFVTKIHFELASTMSYEGDVLLPLRFPSFIPMIGDFIKSDFDSKYYEITNVQDTEQQFLNAKHTWQITVRAFIDDKLSINPETSAVPLSSLDDIKLVSDVPDILEINNTITSAFSAIAYDDPVTHYDNPFGGW